MELELTKDSAIIYLGDLLNVLTALSHTLAMAAELQHNTPAGRLPEGMLSSLEVSWESLDSRFLEVYAAVYGSDKASSLPQASGSNAEASMGPPAVQ